MDTKAFYKISYGMYIISAKFADKLNGQIANTVVQISSDPPTVAVSINKLNLTHSFISATKRFGVSVLSVDASMKLIGQFGFKSGREIDKFEGIAHKLTANDVPIVTESSIAYLECELIDKIDVFTHTIFIGKIVDSEVLSDAEPMTYAIYHSVKGGKSPKNAPTFIKDQAETKSGGGTPMKKYVCTVCGYVYDPVKGDSDSGIPPNTSFESLPESWSCPVCGADKSAFEPEN
jgi:flavin reductase (DIM6/NTAB) family NADH-FMN oxidoreductase RutF/rubredoxin